MLENLPERHGYRVDWKSTFVLMATPELIARADDSAMGDGGYSWVLWDPADDADGFLLTGDHPNQLRRTFEEHFPDLE